MTAEWYEVELYWPYTRGWQFHAHCDTRMQAIHVCALERRHGGWTRVWRVTADGRREVVS